MISLLQLGAELGSELAPCDGADFSAKPVTGVHVSELEDPTPYLEGGELLLTTGMPFAASAALSRAYMARLGAKNVHAVGLGLGPWLRSVPGYVVAASVAAGIELAIVPDGVPFQNVTRAYWRLSTRDDTSNLMDSLGTQTALARAAMRPDATSAVVRGLAQALGGWAAYLPADAGQETVWPASAGALVPDLRAESIRFNKAGVPSAATFEIHGQPVVLYPILLGTRIHGFLCIGSGRTLTKADRQVIMTVSTLLALRARQREVIVGTTNALGAATTKLLLHGQSEAAHMVAEDVGLGELPSRVRLLGIRLSPGDDPGLAARAAVRLAADPGLPDLAAAVDKCVLRHVQDSILYLVLSAAGLGNFAHGRRARLAGRECAAGRFGARRTRAVRVAGRCAGRSGEPRRDPRQPCGASPGRVAGPAGAPGCRERERGCAGHRLGADPGRLPARRPAGNRQGLPQGTRHLGGCGTCPGHPPELAAPPDLGGQRPAGRGP